MVGIYIVVYMSTECQECPRRAIEMQLIGMLCVIKMNDDVFFLQIGLRARASYKT